MTVTFPVKSAAIDSRCADEGSGDVVNIRVDELRDGDLIFLLANQTHLFYPGVVIFCLMLGEFEGGRAVGMLDGVQRFDSYLLDSEGECFVLRR